MIKSDQQPKIKTNKDQQNLQKKHKRIQHDSGNKINI